MSTIIEISFPSATGSGAQNVLFRTWQQRPMKPMKQVEYTTRLGGSQLIISNVKTESPMSQVVATMTANEATVKQSIEKLETQIKILRENIGKRFTMIDENLIVLDRNYIMNMTYNIQAVDGPANALATINMNIMTDTAPTQGS